MTEIKYHIPLFPRLNPVTKWRGSSLQNANTHSLQDAARYASEHAAKEITVSDFLRAAANGQIRMMAILRRTARVQKYDGGIYCNGGTPDENIAPKGAMPYLPVTACQHLSNTGEASWRTFDGFKEDGGIMYRFTEAMLIDGEPDFETIPDDCRVYGREIHALADCLAPLAPVVPPVTTAPPNTLPSAKRSNLGFRGSNLSPDEMREALIEEMMLEIDGRAHEIPIRRKKREDRAFEIETVRKLAVAKLEAEVEFREKPVVPPAPPEITPAPAPSGKRWTTEVLADLDAYRQAHGTKKAALHFGITVQRVRQLLPSKEPRPKGYSAFNQSPK